MGMVLIFLFLFLISVNSDVIQIFYHPQTHPQYKPHKLQLDLLKTKWLSNVEMTNFVGEKDLHLAGRYKALNEKKKKKSVFYVFITLLILCAQLGLGQVLTSVRRNWLLC